MADLVSVEVETLLGALYVFPDMERRLLNSAVDAGARDAGQMVLVNASNAALSMPMRIVKQIRVGESVIWSRGK